MKQFTVIFLTSMMLTLGVYAYNSEDTTYDEEMLVMESSRAPASINWDMEPLAEAPAQGSSTWDEVSLFVDKLFPEGPLDESILIEETRLRHARELLGSSFKKSAAKQLPANFDWNRSLEKYVAKRLPKKFRSQARSIAHAILNESTKNKFDPVFVVALIKTESSFNPVAKGSVGEIGLMQIRPETAEWIAKKYNIPWSGNRTLKDPIQNIRIGTQYLGWLRDSFGGSATKYLPAYNMGAQKVRRMVANSKQPRIYPIKVMKHYKETYMRLTAAEQAKRIQ